MTRVLYDFEGLWRFSREIEDRTCGQSVHAQGTCRFIPDAAGLIQVEEGVLEIPGQPPLKAERRYLWRQAAGGIVVSFDDDRPFHQFDPSAAQSQAIHQCAPDRYEVCYEFAAWPLWVATWEVRGPRKDYVSVTRFERG